MDLFCVPRQHIFREISGCGALRVYWEERSCVRSFAFNQFSDYRLRTGYGVVACEVRQLFQHV